MRLTLPLILAFFTATQLQAYQPIRVMLGKPDENKEQAFIDIHMPTDPNGMSVIICPGGGYGNVVAGPEGNNIAAWLREHGITGVVLHYRLPRERHDVPLSDAQAAYTHMREHASGLKLDANRIGVMGFSAGGHLASTLATHATTNKLRPAFAILVYPVITMRQHTHAGSKRNLLGVNPTEDLIKQFSNELRVSPDTPPTFLAHAIDDEPVPPINSKLFHQACKKHDVPSVYLELPDGGHGLNGYQGASWDKWQSESLKWMLGLFQ
ncbi:MAG: alpha/beta hydrolase [Planctomycetaceae bacterium]|mgnify:CR=1 FL=1|nr:alpha/beta hydrolase [Planctomycetaceae bacterium]|tara:strand:+ start:1135 stop:1932 length:798 start_codon:yes stop_codon:yes gene_type:complete